MWKKALSTLVKMDSKEEWDELDVVSKWLIATRSAVTIVTLYSCAIGGLLAIRHGYFNDNWGMSILAWVIVTLGLFIAHGTNNFLNDYTDFARGVDTESYFRTQYSVHPLIQKFWSKEQQFRWFAISGTLAMLAGLFALFTPTSRSTSLFSSLWARWCCCFIPGHLSISLWESFPFFLSGDR